MRHRVLNVASALLMGCCLGSSASAAGDWTYLRDGPPTDFVDRLELADGGSLLVGATPRFGDGPVPRLIRLDPDEQAIVWELAYAGAEGVRLRGAASFGGGFAVFGDGPTGFHLGVIDGDGNVLDWKLFRAEGARAGALTALADGGLALAGSRTWAGGEPQDWYWLARLSAAGELLWQRQEQLIHSGPGAARARAVAEGAGGDLLLLGDLNDRDDERDKISQALSFAADGSWSWGATLKSLLNGEHGLSCRDGRGLEDGDWLLACAIDHVDPVPGFPRRYLKLVRLGGRAGEAQGHVLLAGLSLLAVAPAEAGGLHVLVEGAPSGASLLEFNERFHLESAVSSDWYGDCSPLRDEDCRASLRVQRDGTLVLAGLTSDGSGGVQGFPRFDLQGAPPSGCFMPKPAPVDFFPPGFQHWEVERTPDRPPALTEEPLAVAPAPPALVHDVRERCPAPTECEQAVAWATPLPPGTRCVGSEFLLVAGSTSPTEPTYAWDVDHPGGPFVADATGPTLRVAFDGRFQRTIALRATDDCPRGELQVSLIELRWRVCDRLDELSEVTAGEPPLRVLAGGRIEVQASPEVDAVNLLVGRIGEWPSDGLATQTCHRADGTYTRAGTLVLDEDLPADSWVLASGANAGGSGPWGWDSAGGYRNTGLSDCGSYP